MNRGQDAFPPPFKWTTERPNQAGGEDATQAVPTTATNPAENTQIVGGADSTQIVDMNDSASAGPGPSFGDRTQFVPKIPSNSTNSPPQGTPAPPWGPPSPPQGNWAQPQSPPPWEGQEELVPPWQGYQAQGAEVFEDKPPGKGKVWAIVGAIVLLLAIGGGVVWLSLLNKDNGGTAQDDNPQQQQQQETSKQPPSTSKEPEPYGPLYVPEGEGSGGKTYTAAQLEKSKALPTPDVVLLKQAGLNEARAVVVVADSTTLSLWSFATGDPTQLAKDITNDQGRFGYKKVPAESQDGVDVYTSTQKSANRSIFVYRAHYTNGDNVIRVEAFDDDRANAKAKFEEALAAQLKITPPE